MPDPRGDNTTCWAWSLIVSLVLTLLSEEGAITIFTPTLHMGRLPVKFFQNGPLASALSTQQPEWSFCTVNQNTPLPPPPRKPLNHIPPRVAASQLTAW